MKRKPTPAQIAARERFAEMARSGAFKRKAKRNPAKKTVSQKISQLTREGYPQKQAVAIALNEERAGKVKRNPIKKYIVYTELKPENWKQVRVTENLDIAKELAKSYAESGYSSVVEDSVGAIIYTPQVKANPIVMATDRKPSKRKSNPAKPKRQRMLNISWLTAGGQREIMSVPIEFVFTHYVGNVAERFFVRTENGQLIVSEYSTGGRIGQVPYTMRAAALNDREAAKRYVGEMLSKIGAERFKAAVKKFDPIN